MISFNESSHLIISDFPSFILRRIFSKILNPLIRDGYKAEILHLFKKGIWPVRIKNLITIHDCNQILCFREVDDVMSISR